MSAEVLEEVRQTVAEVFGVDASGVTPATSAEMLPAWDSMGHLNLILATEQRFSVMFDPEDVPKLTSVQSLADAVSAQKK
jgi:acyl carrier protein